MSGHSAYLTDMLNILDGLPERSGHVIMLDTNDLELFKMFDEAVQRRIDRYIVWLVFCNNDHGLAFFPLFLSVVAFSPDIRST